MSDEALVIGSEDLSQPEIEAQVQEDRSLEDMARASRSTIRTPLLRSPFFYYPFAGLVGALIGWTLSFAVRLVPALADWPLVLAAINAIAVSAGIGMMLGLVFGLIYRNPRRALAGGMFGLLMALAAAPFLAGAAQLVEVAILDLPLRLKGANGLPLLDAAHGPGFFLRMSASGLGWALLGVPLALGPGVVLGAPQLRYSGAIAGSVGGLIGGLGIPLFDRWLGAATVADGAGLLQAEPLASILGMGLVGLSIGTMFAVMELASREGWFILAKGPLRGKRFVLYKQSIVIGSTRKCDLYLFNDPHIAPVQATLSREGLRWLLLDEDSPSGTFVNGHRTQQCLLNNNDVVTMGATVLKFRQRKLSS